MELISENWRWESATGLLVAVYRAQLHGRALQIAADIVRSTGERLYLVHVVSFSSMAGFEPSGATAAWQAAQLNADACHVDCELQLAGREVDWEFEQLSGPPGREIVQAARRHNVRSIVMSHHPHRRVGRFVFGSTVTDVLRDSTVPVFVVPEAARAVQHPSSPSNQM